ncbi:MAG: hypothetical protein AAGC55_34505, partial [Myxococcota bacterium]
QAQALGLISELDLGDRTAAEAATESVAASQYQLTGPGLRPAAASASAGPGGAMPYGDSGDVLAQQALWQSIPAILTEVRDRAERDAHPVPIYVRTTTGAWGAWAYALQHRDSTGMSRAIVDGDILSGAVAPPDRSFHLIYDDPAHIASDQQQPTMQAFMEQADQKFVVSAGDDSIPDGFIQLTLASGNDE